jgi:hypothetical protein
MAARRSSCRRRRGIEPGLMHELGVGAVIKQAMFPGLLQGLAQQVTAEAGLVALTDGVERCTWHAVRSDPPLTAGMSPALRVRRRVSLTARARSLPP